MKIGILQTGHAPEDLIPRSGDYPEMFRRLLGGHGFDFRTWAVVDGEFPEGPEAADGWLITGSKHGVYEDLPWIARLEALVREIRAARKPLVGVCFGHQVIAQALGGKVEKYPGGWAVGRQGYAWGDRALTLNAWHQDQVTQLPPGARVVAHNEFCPYAALLYGDEIYTVQPHPEFSADFIEGLLDTRGKGLVPEPLMHEARRNLHRPTDSDEIGRQIARFLTERKIA